MPIRRFIALTFFLCMTISGIRAQDYYESKYDYKRVSMGIVFSPNIDWLRYGDVMVKDNQAKVGYSYGLLADFAFAENYYFSTGLFINNIRSASQTYEPGPADGTVVSVNDFKLQYAEIPLTVKLKSTQRYYRSYYGQFGFTAGVKLGAKQRSRLEDDPNQGEFNSMGGNANPVRLALQIGGGVEWLLDHNLRLLTGLSYNNGFTNTIKRGSPKDSYIALNFGILF